MPGLEPLSRQAAAADVVQLTRISPNRTRSFALAVKTWQSVTLSQEILPEEEETFLVAEECSIIALKTLLDD